MARVARVVLAGVGAMAVTLPSVEFPATVVKVALEVRVGRAIPAASVVREVPAATAAMLFAVASGARRGLPPDPIQQLVDPSTLDFKFLI